MPFYYTLHHLLPETERFCEGRRNCATFLFGTLCYAVAYVLVQNARLRWGAACDALPQALFMAWAADCAVMGVTYRGYYGRSILCELGADGDGDQRHWVYDEATHRYRKPTHAEVQEAERAREQQAADRAARAAARERTARIERRKREIRAARTIQRWWRARLYDPPRGVFYLRAKERFEGAAEAVARE